MEPDDRSGGTVFEHSAAKWSPPLRRRGRGCVSPRDRAHACTLEACAKARSLSSAFPRNRPCPRVCMGPCTPLHACTRWRSPALSRGPGGKRAQLDRSAASYRVRSAGDRGFAGSGEQSPHTLAARTRRPSPQRPRSIPQAWSLQANTACKRAGEMEGIDIPPPPQDDEKDSREGGGGTHPPGNECTPARVLISGVEETLAGTTQEE